MGLRSPDGLKPFSWLVISAVAFKLFPDAAVPEECPSVRIGGLHFGVGGQSLLFLREGDSAFKLSDVWLIFPTVEAVEAPDITELMLSMELLGEMLGDVRSLWPLAGILIPDDLEGIVLLIPDFNNGRTGTLWAVLFLLLRVAGLIFASGLVSIDTSREVAADVKEPDFVIELDFVPPPDLRPAEVLAVLPAACLLEAPPERENTYQARFMLY